MKSGYSVLRFVHQRVPDGRVTQEVRRCGEFDDIEQAFDTARLEVLREWQEIVNQTPVHARARIRIKDTEWGYDLQRGYEVLSRYWVHDNAPAVIRSH
jgi:hypothetical protein